MAQITRIVTFDGDDWLIVPGEEPAEILAAAEGELDDHECILTSRDEIQIRWWRVSPCHPNSCPEVGGHKAHWTQTDGQTRGGFRAAALVIGEREASCRVHGTPRSACQHGLTHEPATREAQPV